MSITSTWRRRYAHPGIYLYRTRKHMRPGSEWGYGGKSRRLDLRDPQHQQTSAWYDLMIKRYTLELPWWLGFDWITLSLETLLILTFRPRYNIQKNPRGSKVNAGLARAQRRAREIAPSTQDRWQRWSLGWALVKYAGALMIVAGAGGWLWTR